MQKRCRPRGFVTSFQFCPDRGSTSLSKSRDSPVLSWLVLSNQSFSDGFLWGQKDTVSLSSPLRSLRFRCVHTFSYRASM